MDAPSTVESLSRILESEEASETLEPLAPDAYAKLAAYAQRLRATTSPGSDDVSGRLARKQLWLVEVMTRRLVQLRLTKALRLVAGNPDHQRASKNLLPEERYLCDVLSSFSKNEERFVMAVPRGQPSYFALVQKREARRMATLRISRRIGEIIGADLKRYGPFEVNDVARLPAANARAMVAGGQAAPVSTED